MKECWINPNPKHPEDHFSSIERPGWVKFVPATLNTLEYIDSDGARRELEDCALTVNKAGKFWLWSEQLRCNLAYNMKTKEACLLESISSLLFTIKLRDERIAELQRIADIAQRFANEIKPDELKEPL